MKKILCYILGHKYKVTDVCDENYIVSKVKMCSRCLLIEWTIDQLADRFVEDKSN